MAISSGFTSEIVCKIVILHGFLLVYQRELLQAGFAGCVVGAVSDAAVEEQLAIPKEIPGTSMVVFPHQSWWMYGKTIGKLWEIYE